MQDEELDINYQNDELAIESNKYVKSVQFIVLVLDYLRLNRNERLQRYIETFIELKR